MRQKEDFTKKSHWVPWRPGYLQKEHPDIVGKPQIDPKIDGKMHVFPELYIVWLSPCNKSPLSFFILSNKMPLHRHQIPDLVEVLDVI